MQNLPSDIIKNVENAKISDNCNFESKAREIRYQILYKNAKKNKIDYTFTAHHMKDQIETLIMKFIDGGDLISMLGIRKEIDKIYRPILGIEKKMIKGYVKSNNVIYFEDPTNNLFSFNRNKVASC